MTILFYIGVPLPRFLYTREAPGECFYQVLSKITIWILLFKAWYNMKSVSVAV